MSVTAEEKSALIDAGAAYDIATHEAMADLDAITDWLRGQCIGMTRATSDYEARIPMRLSEASVATILHAALEMAMNGDNEMAGHALGMITDRYLISRCDKTARRAVELRGVK